MCLCSGVCADLLETFCGHDGPMFPYFCRVCCNSCIFFAINASYRPVIWSKLYLHLPQKKENYTARQFFCACVYRKLQNLRHFTAKKQLHNFTPKKNLNAWVM